MHRWARSTCPRAWWEGQAVKAGGRRWWCRAARRWWWWCPEVQGWALEDKRGRVQTPDPSPTLTLFNLPQPRSPGRTQWVKGFLFCFCFLAYSFLTCGVPLTVSYVLVRRVGPFSHTPKPFKLTTLLPWCHLKTTIKSAKCENLKAFLFLFCACIWKDFHWNG